MNPTNKDLTTLTCKTDWRAEFAQFQHASELNSFCDTKLICSDGYILCHRAIIPKFRKTSSDDCTGGENLSSEIIVPTMNLSELSRLVLLLYHGSVFCSKRQEKQLMSLLELFEVKNISRHTIKRLPRRNVSAKDVRLNQTLTLIKTELSQKKIRASRKLSISETFRHVYIFGDGNEIFVPVEESPDTCNSSTEVYYDENGAEIQNPETETCSYFCRPCEIIFCDSGDFQKHRLECKARQACPVPLTLFKSETEDSAAPASSMINISHLDYTFGTILCTICADTFKDALCLLIHSETKHGIFPGSDYDVENRKCMRCMNEYPDLEITEFFYHVYYCENTTVSQQTRVKIEEEKYLHHLKFPSHCESTQTSASGPNVATNAEDDDEKMEMDISPSTDKNCSHVSFEELKPTQRSGAERETFSDPSFPNNCDSGIEINDGNSPQNSTGKEIISDILNNSVTFTSSTDRQMTRRLLRKNEFPNDIIITNVRSISSSSEQKRPNFQLKLTRSIKAEYSTSCENNFRIQNIELERHSFAANTRKRKIPIAVVQSQSQSPQAKKRRAANYRSVEYWGYCQNIKPSRQVPWTCRKCNNVLPNQRAYMHHSCPKLYCKK